MLQIDVLYIAGETCQAPDHKNGRITIVDKWSQGFAGLVEFERVPDVVFRAGWSILIAFDDSLGPVSSQTGN